MRSAREGKIQEISASGANILGHDFQQYEESAVRECRDVYGVPFLDSVGGEHCRLFVPGEEASQYEELGVSFCVAGGSIRIRSHRFCVSFEGVRILRNLVLHFLCGSDLS